MSFDPGPKLRVISRGPSNAGPVSFFCDSLDNGPRAFSKASSNFDYFPAVILFCDLPWQLFALESSP